MNEKDSEALLSEIRHLRKEATALRRTLSVILFLLIVTLVAALDFNSRFGDRVVKVFLVLAGAVIAIKLLSIWLGKDFYRGAKDAVQRGVDKI